MFQIMKLVKKHKTDEEVIYNYIHNVGTVKTIDLILGHGRKMSDL